MVIQRPHWQWLCDCSSHTAENSVPCDQGFRHPHCSSCAMMGCAESAKHGSDNSISTIWSCKTFAMRLEDITQRDMTAVLKSISDFALVQRRYNSLLTVTKPFSRMSRGGVGKLYGISVEVAPRFTSCDRTATHQRCAICSPSVFVCGTWRKASATPQYSPRPKMRL